MSFIKEFKTFAVQGNVMDLAIGVIIGAAFAKIVDALVKDILTPVLGIFIGPRGYENAYTPLSKTVVSARVANPNLSLEEARKLGNVLAWGDFITIVINFIIIAFIIFLMVKLLNRLRLSQGTEAILEHIKKDKESHKAEDNM